MPGKRITPAQKQIYWGARAAGKSIVDSAFTAGISKGSGENLEKQRKDAGQFAGGMLKTPDPIVAPRLGKEAKRALEDFGYFQRRYFGRIPYHWQIEAANKARELLESPHKEYLVVNCPPGVGKTTLFTHDIPAWLTCNNRQIRGMMGAATTALAARYTNRLRPSSGPGAAAVDGAGGG